MAQKVTYNIVEYHRSNLATWDNFVDQSVNGNIFHKQKFLSYHSKNKFSFNHLLIYNNKNELVSVIPGGIVNNNFVSPVGSSFGGILVTEKNTLSESLGIIDAFIDYCSGKKYNSIEITLPPQIYNKLYNRNIEFALKCKEFDNSFSLYHSVIDLSKKYSLETLSGNNRRKIRSAKKKGVKIRESDDFKSFYGILFEHNKKFRINTTPHNLDDLLNINSKLPGFLKLFLAYVDERPVGGTLLFLPNEKTALNFYDAYLSNYGNMYLINALVFQSILWAQENGYNFYDYGGNLDDELLEKYDNLVKKGADVNDLNPEIPYMTLVKFKESLGCLGEIRQTFELNLFNVK